MNNVDVASVDHLVCRAGQVLEPYTIEEALSSDDADKWQAAADSEYSSLLENHTWDIVELPYNRETIPCKWVFKVKYKQDESLQRYKARLVAKGYAQKHKIDYDETFSPVVCFSLIRVLLVFALQHNMHIHQMDVVTAFLHGDLEEEIYMTQPSGYSVKGKENLICRLKKSLYGLKQSPRCWAKAFQQYVETVGFSQSAADPFVFVRAIDLSTIIAVYVDDLILITSGLDLMVHLKNCLAAQFKMKDMGPPHYLLGITVDCISIHQKQYILRLVKRLRMEDAKPVSTPADISVKLTKDDGVSKEVDSTEYQSLVGSLLYAAIATRPDFSQAVGAASKFCSSSIHVTAAKRILRYLKSTANTVLTYCKSSGVSLVGYSDADWAGDLATRRSTSGTLFLMSEGAISWTSKIQSVVALSSSEAEYIALSMATQEATWMQKLLNDLHARVRPVKIMEDNQGAIAIAKNPVTHARTKHIDIRFHYV